ncbi:MAG: glycoside hydrolase family 28 protein, partial [Eubacterium sp.]|nr:glycoside hydrolase family 28 protein [Eubacterium sp.]
MKLDILKKNARCVVIKIDDGGHYNTRSDYDIILNGSLLFKTDKSITTILGLLPDTFYIAEIGEEKLEFKTDKEFVTLCVKDFGAKGDGIHDDTLYIQAAIMSCPQKSRVLIPAGDYLVNNLFLISNIKIELQRGARIIMNSERFAHPIMPGMTESYDGLSEYNLGTWEGNPLSMFAACITGINVKNVEIYGEGEIFGNASQD